MNLDAPAMHARFNRRQTAGYLVAGWIASSLAGMGSSAIAKSPRTTLVVAKAPAITAPEIEVTLTGRDGQPVVPLAAAIHPDGQRVVVGLSDESIEVWSTRDMKRIGRGQGHRDRIRCLAFSDDGRRMLSVGNDASLLVWNANKMRIERRFERQDAIADGIFVGDQMAAVGFAPRVEFIDPSAAEDNGQNTLAMRCECRDLRAVACDDAGRQVAAGGRDGVLHVYDVRRGQCRHSGPIHRRRITAITYQGTSDGGRWWSVGEDGRVVVTDAKTLKPLHQQRVCSGRLFDLTITESGWVAVAGSDNDIRLLRSDDADVIGRLQGHRGSITNLQSHGDRLYSFGFDASMRRWDLSRVDRTSLMRDRLADGLPHDATPKVADNDASPKTEFAR